ncbi:trifunctional serine/threonine-protein kinase/ATP-binding protein/sensor histidine kinase [Ramlibacter sp.]|uniref:trifunctional serine/threonine-protein kinase/ATP-binding protein/sensor histidine kinase n=1 Tax=Ramlibacter sp. TaxID=1917967 RepID=UPI003D0D8D3A
MKPRPPARAVSCWSWAPPGVGKTTLLEQLRPYVLARGGRFVAGRIDPRGYREASEILQLLGELGRLLAAESVHRGEDVRPRLLRALGPHAGLARIVPALAPFLENVPDAREADPAHAAARMAQLVAAVLRATATPAQPLVVLLDDLQWSGTLCVRVIDAILGAGLQGLLLVGACRDAEMPAQHPMATAMKRWIDEAPALHMLAVDQLELDDTAQLLALRLGVDADTARPLAEAMAAQATADRGTRADGVAHAEAARGTGNPLYTIERVKALVDRGLLRVRGPGELSWEPEEVRRYLAATSVEELIAARIASLAPQPRELLQALACIGAPVSRETAVAASEAGAAHESVAARCLETLFEGEFLLRPDADGMLRWPHGAVQQAAYERLPPAERPAFHLSLARRLESRGFTSLAADPYVFAVDVIQRSPECVRVADLLSAAAAQAERLGNPMASCRMLGAALRLLDRWNADDTTAVAGCEVAYHRALCFVGRPEDADAIYRRIDARTDAGLIRVHAQCVQVLSNANRGRLDEAVALGAEVLRSLGLDVPADFGDLPDARSECERARRWVDAFDLERERGRAEACPPWVAAAGRMIMTLGSFAPLWRDASLLAWMVFASRRLWEEHGPSADLVACFSYFDMVAVSHAQDRRTAYRSARQAIDMGVAMGWESCAARARYNWVLGGLHWFDPLERRAGEVERAREEWLASGELRDACFASRLVAIGIFECGPTLRRYAEELHASLALARRLDNRQARDRCEADLKLHDALLHGPNSAAPELDPETSVDASGSVGSRWSRWYDASWSAMVHAIYGDMPRLARDARLALGLHDAFASFYTSTWSHWLGGIAMAWELRQCGEDAAMRASRLREIDARIDWLRQRAIDSPSNFRHMHLHLLAERAWALGSHDEAAQRFDGALTAVERTTRPWHAALVTERAARCHLARGLSHSGMGLLREAQQLYAAWGATGKVAQLAGEIGAAPDDTRIAVTDTLRPHLPVDDVDLIGLLRAAESMRTESNPQRIWLKVAEVLCSLTGATRVTLAVRDDEGGAWRLRSHADGQPDRASSAVVADAQGVPGSVLRYLERTGLPLVVPDVRNDERFRRDPFFRSMPCRSLMGVPLASDGRIDAVLILANSTTARAFHPGRLDATGVVASQLAATLRNAHLHERLQRRVGEQERILDEAQANVVAAARRAGMAQIATNVLHNVGNVLTSVNVSAHVLTTQVRGSRSARVSDLADLLREPVARAELLRDPGKSRLLPAYVRQLAGALVEERAQLLKELEHLSVSVDHIKNVVAVQHAYSGATGTVETCVIGEVIDDALRIHQAALAREGVEVTRDWGALAPAPLDKTRVMQILLNLIENARHAMEGVRGAARLHIAVRERDGWSEVAVRDNGCGVPAASLARIFSLGFTTKQHGHGFGLHGCLAAARELGGTLHVHSDGAGTGTTFTLRLPVTLPLPVAVSAAGPAAVDVAVAVAVAEAEVEDAQEHVR